MKKLISVLALLMLIAAGATGIVSCGASTATTTHSDTQTSPPAGQTTVPVSTPAGLTTVPVSTPAGQTTTPVFTPGQTANILIENFSFSPASITITAGTTVTWKNNDSAGHPIASDTGVFKSGDMATGGTFSYTFNNKGTFTYHCTTHPSMKGTVIVQ